MIFLEESGIFEFSSYFRRRYLKILDLFWLECEISAFLAFRDGNS